MKKGTLKVLSMALSAAMVSAFTVVPNIAAAEIPAPVVSYNFESDAAGLTLAGEAKLTTLEGNGVLQLATKESHNETYAKFAADAFSNADFTNGMTVTIKFNPTGYISDWTPIYMLGDSELGSGDSAKNYYQLTQGWTSRITNETKLVDGYYGNEVSAPYTWDYISLPENQNKWYTLTATITPESMTTYIDGVQVQTATAGHLDSDQIFNNFLSNFKTYTGNFIGSSYYSNDADFQGYVDNVAVFNSALTAEQVAGIDTIFTSDNATAPTEPSDTEPGTATDSAIDTTPTTPAPDNNTVPTTPAPDNNTAPTTTEPEAGNDDQQDANQPSDDVDDTDDEAAVKAVKLNKKKATVKVGKSVKLKVKNTSKKVTWSSSNKKVAKVSKAGKVTGVKAGKATIKAKVGGKTLKCKVTVK